MKKFKKVFIDADAFIALNIKDHPNHLKAIEISKQIQSKNHEISTCSYVIVETVNILAKFHDNQLAIKVAIDIMGNPELIVTLGDRFLMTGVLNKQKQKSKQISLNDCVYFEIAKALKVDYVFSFDKHWKKNGFTLL